MIKVTLLGDSIRAIGYGKVVPELLGNQYEVFQPSDNCRFAKYTLRGLFDWSQSIDGSNIIHWNNGLWDICDLFGDGPFSSEEEYVSNILRIADILLKKYDKVIFATTTPVSPKNLYNKNSHIERYNGLVVPHLEKYGVIINDLYSLVSQDIDKYICDDTIHLSECGIQVCAKQVVDLIKSVAREIEDVNIQCATKNFTSKTDDDLVGVPV